MLDQWWHTYQRAGDAGLIARKHPGPAPRLTEALRAQLVTVLLAGAQAYGFETELWTLPRIARVIQELFGVRYHRGHIWHLLRKLGWSRQKPTRRARERNEEAIAQWQEVTWSELCRRPPRRAQPWRSSTKAASPPRL